MRCVAFACIFLWLTAPSWAQKVVLRVGHFPNVTHAQALVAHQLTRQGKGWFESRLGAEVTIQWFVYNAGPSAMEAIFARSLDLTYVGPNPALNAHIKSLGEEIRVVAGAARGGAALVVRGDGMIRTPADFRGRRIATPQLGNTQDVACRVWLGAQGFKVTQVGGDVLVVPAANPDQLALFRRGDIAGAWTVEPWVSMLERQAGGKMLVEERDAITTILASSARFLGERRELARKFVQAHAELTAWLAPNSAEAQKLIQAELAAETRREMPAELLSGAWQRLRFTTDISRAELEKLVADAQRVGFLPGKADVSRLVEAP
jgi:NitT/TauT family transport system substrate-binding protein